ncbi:hypothetical protein D7I41_20690 [Ochrobactrum sp. MH181795]|nr:hypothetical protein BG46_08260 [Brucella anthropi]RNL41206.1 hypothetical protein D7I41_20690 [Ochrobactrum sp. MH181795]
MNLTFESDKYRFRRQIREFSLVPHQHPVIFLRVLFPVFGWYLQEICLRAWIKKRHVCAKMVIFEYRSAMYF